MTEKAAKVDVGTITKENEQLYTLVQASGLSTGECVGLYMRIQTHIMRYYVPRKKEIE
jgi:hypothetical protein